MESPSRPCSNCGSIRVADSCCVLRCGDGSSDGTIFPFVDHTWQMQEIVIHTEDKKPKVQRSGSAWTTKNHVNNKKTGYHTDCYRKFIALRRNTPPKNDDVESKSVHARSKSTVAIVSSSTGIMPKICIFCTKKDKKHNGSKQKLVSVETGYFEERSRNVQQPYGIKHYYPNCEALILSPKKYAIMGYAERSIRQLQSKFQKQAKIKRQQSVESIIGTEEEKFILKLSNQYARRWRIRSLQVAMCWV